MDYLDMVGQEDVFSSQLAESDGVHNHEMNVAWRFVTSTNVSVFLTGKAGTGKTTFLRKLRERTPKRMVVLAPTASTHKDRRFTRSSSCHLVLLCRG